MATITKERVASAVEEIKQVHAWRPVGELRLANEREPH